MNAGGLPEGVAESELFGHVKGAFTDARVDRIGCFELADEGTLFLDEIANMPVRLQAKLLRVLQTGEVQRVGSSRLAATSTCACCRRPTPTSAREIAAGRFREDLLYRLNTVVIHLPPLRDRREDIAAARARIFSRTTAARYRKPLERLRRRRADGARRRTAGPATSASSAHSVERAVLMADPAAREIAVAIWSCRAGARQRRSKPTSCRSKTPNVSSSRRSSRVTAAMSGWPRSSSA